MSTRQTFAHEIAGRARRIGWPVEMGKDGGWNITTPSGKVVQVHLTPSDVNADKAVMQKLKREGFDAAEAEWAQLNEDARQRVLAEQRVEEQRKLDLAQKRADMLAKASGQQRISEEVLLTPTSMPKTFERVLVTPELANKLLDLNTENRPIRQREVNLWITIIQKGEWRYTHQGIAIDSRGILQDGQHRLSAIMQTDTPVEMQISIGMPPENFAAIDTGIRRTFGDVVARHGLSNRNRIGTASRLLVIYDEWPSRLTSAKVNNTEIDILLRRRLPSGETVGERILEAVNVAQSMWYSFRINVSGAAVVIYKLWEMFGRDNEEVETFLEGLRTGENLNGNDPRFVLRRMLTSPNFKDRTSWHHLALLVKTWNKWIAGDSVKLLSFRKGEEIPRIAKPVEEE